VDVIYREENKNWFVVTMQLVTTLCYHREQFELRR